MYGERSGIRAADVTVQYGDVVAVTGVSVEVPPGSFLAVSGPSGAGKSSLLWAIAGALRPASGTVLIAENRSATGSRRALAASC